MQKECNFHFVSRHDGRLLRGFSRFQFRRNLIIICRDIAVIWTREAWVAQRGMGEGRDTKGMCCWIEMIIYSYEQTCSMKWNRNCATFFLSQNNLQSSIDANRLRKNCVPHSQFFVVWSMALNFFFVLPHSNICNNNNTHEYSVWLSIQQWLFTGVSLPFPRPLRTLIQDLIAKRLAP